VNTLVDEKGDLVDEKTINQIHKAAAELVDMANRLK
jgi:hypothetical protein